MDTKIEYKIFFDKYFSIYPQGDPAEAHRQLEMVLNEAGNIIILPDGEKRPIEFEDIVKRYKMYIHNWDTLYAEKQARGYLNSNNEKAAPDAFLYRGLWRSEYSDVEKNPVRSEYLFGKDKAKIIRAFNYFTNFIIKRKGAIPIMNDIPIREPTKEMEKNNKEQQIIKPNIDADISFDITLDENKDQEDPF